jgi:hypothetical protein
VVDRAGHTRLLDGRKLAPLDALVGMHIHINEAVLINAGVDLEQAVLALVEARDFIKLGGLGQPALGVVAPAVIPAAEDQRRARRLLGHAVGAVPAHVVEGPQLGILAEDEEKRVARDFVGDVVAGLAEAAAVADADPVLNSGSELCSSNRQARGLDNHFAKNCSTLQLKECIVRPPSYRKLRFLANLGFGLDGFWQDRRGADAGDLGALLPFEEGPKVQRN